LRKKARGSVAWTWLLPVELPVSKNNQEYNSYKQYIKIIIII